MVKISILVAFAAFTGVLLLPNFAFGHIIQQIKSGNSDFTDITIPQGRLRGFIKQSRQGRNYTAFYKVPYAEAPLGNLRFKGPIAPRSGWEGLRAIPDVAPQCIQQDKYAPVIRAVGEEDCLYSNIYVPSISNNTLLPVMVYIHGGGFVDGNGSRYGVEYFMDEPVIVATMQYRLGPIGFISTEDDEITGNMGFKDQVQMLKWTRDNIQYFGGDPNRVTIYGNSAGAMSVGMLMLSPMATGLFHRAITQSGASLCANSITVHNPRQTIDEMARELNCDATNSAVFLACLQTKNASDIALVRTSQAVYGLTIENHHGDQVFMPDTPYHLVQSNPNKVPYIIGVVKDEWAAAGLMVLQDPQIVQALNANFAAVMGSLLNVNLTIEELESVKDFYFGNKLIGNETFRELFSLFSDPTLIHCSYVSAYMHAAHSPTYLYYLSKPPALSYLEKTQPGYPAKELGIVTHADELQFLFLYYGYPKIPKEDQEYFEFSKYAVNQWAIFAADGKPSEEWQPITGTTSDAAFWMELNDQPGRTQVINDRMEFWDQFSHEQLNYDFSLKATKWQMDQWLNIGVL